MKMENMSLLLLLLFSVFYACDSNRIKRLENRVARIESSAIFQNDMIDFEEKLAELNTSVADCLPSERVAATIPDTAVKDKSLSHLTRMKVALADEKALWRREAAAMETAIAENKQDIEQAKSEVQNHVQKTLKELRAEAQTLETTLNSVKDDVTAYIDLSTKDVKNDVQNSIVQKNDEVKTYIDSSIKEIRDLIVDKLTAMESKVFPQSCLGYYNNGARQSGVYTIYIFHPSKLQPVQVYCDMDNDGGGWTVFQRRQDGSVDFYRTWKEYASGFGNVNGEFWLGNDIISALTSNGRHELRVDLENYDGETRFAKYSNFRVSTSQDNYKLQVSRFNGDAGDSLSYHNGKAFTTRDQDNDDKSSGNCAQDYSGAWWYDWCHHSNLNGLYGQGHGGSGVEWQHWKYNRPLKKTTMMLRARPHT